MYIQYLSKLDKLSSCKTGATYVHSDVQKEDNSKQSVSSVQIHIRVCIIDLSGLDYFFFTVE